MTPSVSLHFSLLEVVLVVPFLVFLTLAGLLRLVRNAGDDLFEFWVWFSSFRRRIRALRMPE
jgi:hypothetical protein